MMGTMEDEEQIREYIIGLSPLSCGPLSERTHIKCWASGSQVCYVDCKMTPVPHSIPTPFCIHILCNVILQPFQS